MKIAKLFAILGVVGLISLSSCKKNECQECVDADGLLPTQSFCEDDYTGPGSGTLYSAQIATYEDAGYTCTKK